LRRIFERLIDKAHAKAMEHEGWDDAVFLKSRMDDKIKLLSSTLPKVLVEHSGMYSILSKGIHELSEQECLRYFNTLRLGIGMILDEELAELEKSKQRDILSRAISLIQGEIAE
jgi:hypothetical protein